MRAPGLLLIAALAFAGALFSPFADSQAKHDPYWNREKREAILKLFQPPPRTSDPTNRFMGVRDAELFGEKLFFDPGLSPSGDLSCSSCHDPDRQWTDGRHVAQGVGKTKRNTPTLVGASRRRWLGWTGESAALWSQAIKPLESPLEMGSSRFHVYTYIANQPTHRTAFEAITGNSLRELCAAEPAAKDCQQEVASVFADVGKIIASFEATIPYPQTRFDDFLAGLAEGKTSGPEFPTPAELAGLEIFAGRGLCSACHHGSDLTDEEFHNILVPERVGSAVYDQGRYGIVEKILSQEFSTESRFSDCTECDINDRIRRRQETSMMYAAFRTPTLRGAMCTAPYMHNGIIQTMDDVLLHYSEFRTGVAPAHADDPFVQPRNFTDQDRLALTAFLQMLTPKGLTEQCTGQAQP